MTYTAQQKYEALDREISYRRYVYARRVADGKMTQKAMDHQINIFLEIASDYRKLAESERLI